MHCNLAWEQTQECTMLCPVRCHWYMICYRSVSMQAQCTAGMPSTVGACKYNTHLCVADTWLLHHNPRQSLCWSVQMRAPAVVGQQRPQHCQHPALGRQPCFIARGMAARSVTVLVIAASIVVALSALETFLQPLQSLHVRALRWASVAAAAASSVLGGVGGSYAGCGCLYVEWLLHLDVSVRCVEQQHQSASHTLQTQQHICPCRHVRCSIAL
jgi:hypothetical protein